MYPLFPGSTINFLIAGQVLCCTDRSKKVFYLLYLQQCETSQYTAPQPFTAFSMDPLVVTLARCRGENGEDERRTKIIRCKRAEQREMRMMSNQGLCQTELLRGHARMLMPILAHHLTTASVPANAYT